MDPVKHSAKRIAAGLTAALTLLVAAPAFAAVEDGDAGDLPSLAQDLSDEGVQRIDGRFENGSDLDMYRVCLAGGGTFSATTVGGTTVDTQLFLLDSAGRGVYANDDHNGGRQSLLPAGHPLTPSAPGEYLLTVGPYNLDPVSPPGAIFPITPGVVGPTGPGGAEPIVGWAGRPGGSGAYSIFLTGATCAPPDTTPPTVDLRSPQDGQVVGLGDAVEVDFDCADEGGSELASCVGTVPDGALLDTSEPGPEGVTVTARDNAGNVTTVTHTATVLDVDRIAPAIELLSPFDGAVYVQDEVVKADYSCSDEKGGSGLASCAGDVPDGAKVDTGSVGLHDFTVEAADVAGNTSSATSTYSVIFDFEGFLWPVKNRPRYNRWLAGVPVPIRFELGGKRGLDVIEDGWPQVAEVDCDFGDEPESGVPAKHPWWTRELVFEKRKKRYLFVWKTDHRWSGSCRQFMLKLKDGTVKRADFKFVRRHWDD